MRIVIVEDEKKTRLGLENIITKFTSHEVAASVCDGVEGLNTVCALCPDAVITDIKMPNMDGLTMLEKIREQGIRTRAILLTGFSDFEYARKSIQLGADDYLLKPLNVEEILEVLAKTEEKIARIKKETVSEEQLLLAMLNEEGQEREALARQMEQQMRILRGEQISLFLVRVSSRMESTINEMVDTLKETLSAICMQRYYVFPLLQQQSILVMILDGQRVHYLKELFLMHVIPRIQEIGECMVGCDELEEMAGLPAKLDQMLRNFEYGFGMNGAGLVDAGYIASVRFQEMEYPERLEPLICKAVRSGTAEKVRGVARQFREQVIEGSLRPRLIKEYTLRFGMAAVNAARDRKNSDNLEELYHTLFYNIMESGTREKLLYEYEKIWDSILCEESGEEPTENSIILNVIELIRQNYDKDISLSGAAEAVSVSPEYLSRLFTKEMGINFSTFLGDFRISMAKRMLTEEKYRIYEVAEAVGFRDTKYFNKVFRSVTGVSPSDYRKTVKNR